MKKMERVVAMESSPYAPCEDPRTRLRNQNLLQKVISFVGFHGFLISFVGFTRSNDCLILWRHVFFFFFFPAVLWICDM